MRYRVLLERAVEKELARLSDKNHDQVIAAIQTLGITSGFPEGQRGRMQFVQLNL
jgi:mRNA-degrading endonuclease RelE of RelBE toxin-antitoxin system